MSLLFSAVTARTEDDEVELLVPGIPTEMDDFDGWVLFENFLHGIDSEQEVRVHVESYNAPTTIGSYYSALVQHDLYGSSRD